MDPSSAEASHRQGRGPTVDGPQPAATRTTTIGGAEDWLWIGADDRGRELEIIAVQVTPAEGEAYLLVIHVMPTQLRRRSP